MVLVNGHLLQARKDLPAGNDSLDHRNLAHIKGHYYRSHPSINPSGIVPAGPAIDFDEPHGRDRLKLAA